VNCHRIHQKSLNIIYPFKFYSNFTNKNVSWLHFNWATQYADPVTKMANFENSRSWTAAILKTVIFPYLSHESLDFNEI